MLLWQRVRVRVLIVQCCACIFEFMFFFFMFSIQWHPLTWSSKPRSQIKLICEINRAHNCLARWYIHHSSFVYMEDMFNVQYNTWMLNNNPLKLKAEAKIHWIQWILWCVFFEFYTSYVIWFICLLCSWWMRLFYIRDKHMLELTWPNDVQQTHNQKNIIIIIF